MFFWFLSASSCSTSVYATFLFLALKCSLIFRQGGKLYMPDTEHSINAKHPCGLLPIKYIFQFRMFKYFHMTFRKYQNAASLKRNVTITQISDARWCSVAKAHKENIIVGMGRSYSPADRWACYQSSCRSPLWCGEWLCRWLLQLLPHTMSTPNPRQMGQFCDINALLLDN